MLKRIKYTSEFREEAVKLAISSEVASAVVAKNLGVNRNTLYNWIRNSMQEKTNSSKSSHNNINARYKELEQENKALKSKLKRAEAEREILKKAAAYFASQDL
jgi:transposase